MRKFYPKSSPILLLRALLVCLFIVLTMPGIGQTADRRMSINKERVPLEEILNEIQEKTGYKVFYNTQLVGNVTATVTMNNATVDAILRNALENSRLTYTFNNDTIVLSSIETPQSQAMETISGRVTDRDRQPMIGATVRVPGQTRFAVATNVDGTFQLNVPANTPYIEVSYIGMERQQVALRGQSYLTIVMEESATEINDLVVTGIFTRKQESFTGAHATFDKKQLGSVGATNVFQALKNLDPSLNIVENLAQGSNPNAVLEMEIRGVSSFPDLRGQYTQNPNMPLFILDGFEVTAEYVMDMDMNRIQWITILKDASAKAIYGSKAANGVVVIETTRLSSGELRINFTSTLSVTTPDLNSYNMCNAEEKLELERLLGLYNNEIPSQDISLKELYYHNLSEVRKGVNTDWLAQPLRTGVSNKQSLNLEVGNETVRVGIDFGYNDTRGVMKGSKRTAINGAVNIVYRHGSILFRNTTELNNTSATDSPYGEFSRYVQLNPYWRMEDEKGDLLSLLGYGPVFSAAVYNPMIDAKIGTRYANSYFDITNRTNLEWTLNKATRVIGRFTFTKGNSESERFLPSTHSTFQSITAGSDEFFLRGSYDSGYGKSITLSGDVNVNFNRAWGKHAVFANLGANIRQHKQENYLYQAVGLPNEKMDNIIFAKQYALDSKPTGGESLDRELGFLLAANYSYDNRYLFDVSLRESASSQFGSNKRWGTFWSAGLGWNLHHEKFLKESAVVRLLKIRGSAGFTGSQAFNSYQSQLLYNYYLDRSYQGLIGTYLEALANKELQWQQKFDINTGIDINLFNKLNLRFDLYRATTTDMLTDINIPPSLGFATYKANLGKIENNGMEIAASYRVFSNAATRSALTMFFNGIHNSNKIKEISNSLRAINAEQDNLSRNDNRPLVRFEEGQSMTAIWAVKSNGIDPATGKEIFVKKDGRLTDVWDVEDKVVCGDSEAKLRGNFGANFEYQGFTANVVMRYRIGGQTYNQTLINKVENAQVNYNVDKRAYYATWQQEGDHVRFRDIGDWRQPTLATSRFVQDLSTLDISAISLGYDFHRFAFVDKIGMERLQLRFNMNDVANFSTVKIERGTAYPFARTWSFSLIANF